MSTTVNLSRVYRETVASDQITADELAAAMEAAIDAIVQAGFDSQDSDHLGSEMCEDVQTLLTLAFIRCPELMDLFTT